MSKFLIATALAVLSFSHVTIAAPRLGEPELWIIDGQCAHGYGRIDRLLAFLYKFDGNLPPIKETKIKHLRNLMRDFSDIKKSEEAQNTAFKELYFDADYYQLVLEDKSKALIKDLESIKKDSMNDRETALETRNTIAYTRLRNFLRVKDSIHDFFATLEESLQRLDSLNAEHRLTRSLDPNTTDRAFQIARGKLALNDVIDCNLGYLEHERFNRARGTTDRK